jgi:hypothetical protein
MRPLYVLVVWVVILGGLWLYTTARNAVDRAVPTAVEIQPAPGNYELELTPTFDAIGGVDPFALEPTAKPAIVARLNGQEIVRFEQTAASGIPQRFTWDTERSPVQVGKNEVYVELSSPQGDASAFRGVRVRLLRDEAPIADEMLWSQPGAPVQGAVPIDVPATAMDEHKSEEDNHG